MILTVADREYEVDVESRVTTPAPVAIVIPQHGTSFFLTRLAVDAIRKFTPPELADIWVVDNASAMDGALAGLDVSLILNRTPVWSWWQRPEQVGSLANAVALELAVQVLGMEGKQSGRLLAMHSDALPIRPGWLEFLCARTERVVGTKASQRSGYPHSQGVLVDYDFLRRLGPGVLMPNLPMWDVAEGVATKGDYWSAWGLTHVASAPHDPEWCPVRGWLADEDCEVSWFRDAEPDFLHLGGGTVNRRDNHGWIERIRRNLEL